ncbi:MAG: type I polyketide synthase, partial [Geminicoccaceae bacterium]|nr:type I polyketide synthase [Geminicoccaceae bacterium]
MSDDQLEDERIAIIGMAGRFPGARNVAELWANLKNGVESVRRFDDDELRARGIPDELLADPHYVKAGIVLDDVEMFDSAFFGLSPREAALMDPQQRLFLQACYAALEDAGYAGEGPLAAGVFAGSGLTDYLPGADFRPGGDHALEYVKMIGNEKDYLASRIAYHLNLTGPALVVQTACSTSLVAVHLACQNLLTYQCDLALAGGVGILLPQGLGHLHHEGMLLSPDGHCRAFDARAAGYVNGRGLGVVVLKRLSEALANGDRIDAVILGSAINNDGSLKVGFTALSVEGQAEVIASALAMADVPPETIRYVEAFGSGTPLGDTIEVAALTRAFRAETQASGFCRLGSIKTNIGHLDAAAGIAGLIKAALVVKTGLVPPSLHFETPNPEIDFERTPFLVADKLTPLEPGPEPLRTGVSAFGIGGTNAHVILEEPPAPEDLGPDEDFDAPELIVLSTKTPEALEQASRELADFLDTADGEIRLGDVAWTLQAGRRHFDHRRAVVDVDRTAIARELRQP